MITGDFLRPINNMYPIPGQNKNIEWFYNIISSSKIYHEYFYKNPEIHLISLKQFEEIYNCLSMEITMQNYAKIISGNISQEQISILFNIFDSIFNIKNDCYNFVIGYEMPKIMIKYFKNLESKDIKIEYLNIVLHPVRFYKDLLLLFNTNNYDICKYSIKENFVEVENLYKRLNIERSRLNRLPDLNYPENSCLIIGQTVDDKSLVNKDGKILSLMDFENNIIDLKNKYDHLFFKCHPYENIENYSQEILKLMNIVASDTNTYHLMVQDNIKCIYSISSSVCYESQFLNKKSRYFYENPYNIKDFNKESFNKDEYYAFYSDERLIYDYQVGDLRKSLAHEWSYKIFK